MNLRSRLITLLAFAVATALAARAESPRTFCNPLPIPDYPIGKMARDVANGAAAPDNSMWISKTEEQFRELADPTALWHDGHWYLYPSVDMAWVSADNGATWQHRPLNIRDIGYAPTVVVHRGQFLLMASDSALYASSSPLGPFTEIGRIHVQPVSGMPGFTDPMLFSDDDGRLFFYWGCSQSGGIWGAELDAANLTKAITTPKLLIPFDPAAQPWEAVGEWNQDTSSGWVEGSWMLKRNRKYFLTFSAAGTENRTYAMGCYTGENPLGPFKPQGHNPILRTQDGLVTGTGHGCVVAGPDNQLWTFYTLRAGVVHGFERRLGMDRMEMNANGELFIPTATSTPQWLPGQIPAGQTNAATDWIVLNGGRPTFGSSSAPNLPGRFAVDNELRTWWQPAAGDSQPVLTTRLSAPAEICAVRIIWRDVGLDSHHHVLPGPFRYRVELETAKDKWTILLDRSNSQEDFLIDYREVPPTIGARARLVICGWPNGITPAVAEFTLFGHPVGAHPLVSKQAP